MTRPRRARAHRPGRPAQSPAGGGVRPAEGPGRRRRIGYRVQLDTSIGAGAAATTALTGPGATVRRGFFDTTQELTDATIVLLRIENDGGLAIGSGDYTDGGSTGLTVRFSHPDGTGPHRHMRAIVVTAPDHPGLLTHFLTYLRWGSGQDIIRVHAHLPCSTPKGLRICGEG
ncbi:hypothetical protein ACHGLA_16975 [Streptomyces sp. YH02]|uniref:hypothetical protein n=1 Tax=Streptomyces sp. YH02 TaxID=3256999 RepID=UPI003757FD05